VSTDNPLLEEREPDVLEHQQPSAASTPGAPESSGNSAVERAAPAGVPFIRCSAPLKSGKGGCSNGAGPSGACVVHDKTPAGLARMQAARSLGGKAPRVYMGFSPAMVDAIDLRDGDGQIAVLAAATRALATGQIGSATATAISALVRTAAGIVATDQAAAIAELAAKLDELTVDAPRGRPRGR